MVSSKYDWTRFKRQVFIDAKPEAVFNAWAKPGEIIKWFIAQADYVSSQGIKRKPSETIEVGDQYHWRWHQELEARGEILSIHENRSLRFTFGDKEPGSNEKIIVTIDITTSESGDTSLELTQENMANTPEAHSTWHLSCNLGWSFFMTNLKAFLEYGVDLRETNTKRANTSRAVSLDN